MKIKSITKGPKCITLDLEVEDTHSYQLENGVVTHNTSSLIVGSSSGIHAWYSPYYIRRMRVGKNESIYTYLAINHPELLEDDFYNPEFNAIIRVPVKAPDGAITRDESALNFLERVKKWNTEWIKPGHRDGQNTHNVSATVSMRDEEWEEVGEWMWANRHTFNGLSVLPYDGGTYIQTPFEEITREQYEEMIQSLTRLDLSKVIEMDDQTNLTGELACANGSCEIK